MYVWQWGTLTSFWDVFLAGAVTTSTLTLCTILLGTSLGLVVTFARRSSLVFLPEFARIYIELMRATPVLVLLIWIYYVLPLVTGLSLSPFVASLVGLSLHLSSYVAETFRAGIESIAKSQYESGLTLGLHPFQVMMLIVLPQAIRAILPSLFSLYVETLKNSSIASVIGVSDILHNANGIISSTYRPLEIYTAVAGVYLALVIPATIAVGMVEKRLALQRRTI